MKCVRCGFVRLMNSLLTQIKYLALHVSYRRRLCFNLRSVYGRCRENLISNNLCECLNVRSISGRNNNNHIQCVSVCNTRREWNEMKARARARHHGVNNKSVCCVVIQISYERSYKMYVLDYSITRAKGSEWYVFKDSHLNWLQFRNYICERVSVDVVA